MAVIDTVLVKLASRCNLDCDYCYVYHMGDDAWRRQPKLMSDVTLNALADNLVALVAAQGRPLSVVFHGGEPLLVGPARFERICALLRERLPPQVALHVQTNGLLLTDTMIAICARFDVGISISLDGPAEVHDRHRLDRRGQPSHARVLAAVDRLLAHDAGRNLFTGVLSVIDLQADPAAVYAFFKATGAPSVDFLYRDGNHDYLPTGKASLVSTEYGDWMAGVLDAYLADPEPMRIRVLDDMLRLLLGGRSIKEGIGSEDYGILVIETDGTITKNDTLKSANGSDRFGEAWSVRDDLVALVASAQFLDYHRAQRPTAAACRTCRELRVCGGGMPTHRWSTARGLDNPSVFCADQKRLIDHMRGAITARTAA